MDREIYTVFADGGKRKGVTYGSFKIFSSKGKQVAHKQLVFGEGTSNFAEFLSILAAMQFCLNNDLKSITILSDSRLAVMQIRDEWQSNYPHLKRIRNKVWKVRDKFDYFNIKHVKRNLIVSMLGH